MKHVHPEKARISKGFEGLNDFWAADSTGQHESNFPKYLFTGYEQLIRKLVSAVKPPG